MKSKHPPGHCPECGTKEAECIIGDFWKCKTKGCPNGPDEVPTSDYTLPPPRKGVYSPIIDAVFDFDPWDEPTK